MRATTPRDRPPILRFLLLFAVLLGVALGLTALSAAGAEPSSDASLPARAEPAADTHPL